MAVLLTYMYYIMVFLIFSKMFGIFSAAGVEFPRSNAPGNNDKIVI